MDGINSVVINKLDSKNIKSSLEELFITKGHFISIPIKYLNKFSIPINTSVKFGFLEIKVICLPNFSFNSFEINENLMNLLGLNFGMTCNINFKDNRINLGPVIANFCSNGTINKALNQEPNFRTSELYNSNKFANTILYFFSVKDIDFYNLKINGTYYNEINQKWEQKYFPIPDILYDRGGGTLKKQQIVSEYIRDQLNKYSNLLKINPIHLFDKWKVYKILSRNKYLKSYLPLTKLYNDINDIKEMFKSKDTIYIKSTLGNNGRDVIRIIKNKDNTFNLSYFDSEKVINHKINNYKELDTNIKCLMKDSKFIIQHGIDLLQLDGNIVDLRGTIQRNGNGELTFSDYSVRLANNNAPITSTKSGSVVFTIDDFFKTYYKYNESDIITLKDTINEFLYEVYTCIEDEYETFGEIGIDFAIDKDNKLWFIECNAKPGKDSLYKNNNPEVIKQAFLNPLEYGKYKWSKAD